MNNQALNEQTVRTILADVVRKALTAQGTQACCGQMHAGPIPVEISARHAHLSNDDAIALFGEALRPERPLSQPGQFLSSGRVRLIGPKGVMDNVAVLGPSRGVSQVEISKTDARILGIDPGLLVVPSQLEGTARKILVKDADNGNEWAGTAEVLAGIAQRV